MSLTYPIKQKVQFNLAEADQPKTNHCWGKFDRYTIICTVINDCIMYIATFDILQKIILLVKIIWLTIEDSNPSIKVPIVDVLY